MTFPAPNSRTLSHRYPEAKNTWKFHSQIISDYPELARRRHRGLKEHRRQLQRSALADPASGNDKRIPCCIPKKRGQTGCAICKRSSRRCFTLTTELCSLFTKSAVNIPASPQAVEMPSMRGKSGSNKMFVRQDARTVHANDRDLFLVRVPILRIFFFWLASRSHHKQCHRHGE